MPACSSPATDYERQATAAAAAERDARQRAAAAAEEAEHVRSQLSRAEARVAEQELAMQRMVSQFEGALATLQQLEAQYDGLAADAGAADRLRAARIEELEREAAAQRAARAALQQECDSLSASAAAAEAAAAEAKQQYHRAMMDAAELTEALAAARGEAAAAASRAGAAEEELAASRAAAQQAQAALEREVGCHARTQGLLEATRMQHEGARRDAQEQEALCAQLREAAAVLEAERNDCAKAAEAAEAKVGRAACCCGIVWVPCGAVGWCTWVLCGADGVSPVSWGGTACNKGDWSCTSCTCQHTA